MTIETRLRTGMLAAAFAVIGLATFPHTVTAAGPDLSETTEFSAQRHGHAGARGANRGHSVNRSVNVNRNKGVNRTKNVNRNVNVNKSVNRRTNVDVNRRTNVVVTRPVRVWAPRPYFGTVVAGVALGSIVTAAAVGVAPTPPASNLCWYWNDAAKTTGYWDYCS